MSTSDFGAAGRPRPAALPLTDSPAPDGLLPDLALITQLVNEIFTEVPGGPQAAKASHVEPPAARVLPVAGAALPQPPPYAGLPFTPPTSSLSPGWSPVPGLAPTAAPITSPLPIPPLPPAPPSPPPIGPTGAVPGTPTEAELRAIPSTLGAATQLVPTMPIPAGAPAQTAPAVPTAGSVHGAAPPVPGPPAPGQPGLPPSLGVGSAASPVPMPSTRQLDGIPLTLDAVMGFVAAVPWGLEAPVIGPGEAATAVDEAPAVSNTSAVPVQPEAPVFRPDLVPDLGATGRTFDPHVIRRDFPILSERVHGKQLVWLDNAATTQKPQAVIDRLSRFYEHENSNIHRAAHTLAARATDAYESAREKVRRFVNAGSVNEIVFVRGTTEAINLVAETWGVQNVAAGDEILITWLEHHANIVPWQLLCAKTGAVLRVAPVDESGQVILSDFQRLIGPRTKLVSFTHVSNALGTVTPATEMIDIAHRHGARVLLDGAQSAAHMRTDVQALDCDFFVFSGHKIFGPTGIGVLFGKSEVLADMPPWQGGGSMIADVTFERTVYQPPPARFEAGTGNIADAVGLGAALDYLTEVGVENVTAYEHEVLSYATTGLSTVPGLLIIGTAREKAGVLSFVLDGFRAEDVGAALDREGIAVRAGHHCAQPILRRFGLETTVRASLAMYNTCEDIDALVAALHRIQSGRGQPTV
jgi:cysteine desulfurase / selenocysteine lyase